MKTGQEPTSPERGGGVLEGGDTGQPKPATVPRMSTAAVPQGAAGMESRRGMRLGMAYKHSTLLGPEGTTESRHSREVVVFSARHFLALHTVRWKIRVGVGRIGLWVGRWLRIAQWMRASLFSVVKLSRADGGCLGTGSR